MKTYKVLTITAFSILFCVLTTIFPVGRADKAVSIQGQRRTITVSQYKDPPIEVSLDLAGKILLPTTEFNAADGWTENLHIRAKNISKEPITQIEMILGVFSLTEPNVSVLTTHYRFGNSQGTEILQPGDTKLLTHRGTLGDNNVPGAARILITGVIWNGDDSLKWDGGGIRRKVSGGQGTDEPPTYHADPPPIAKVPLPKGLASP